MQGHRRLCQLFPGVWTCSEERFMQAVAAVKVRCICFSHSYTLTPSRTESNIFVPSSTFSTRSRSGPAHSQHPAAPSQDGWAQHLPPPQRPDPASPAVRVPIGPYSEPSEATEGRPPPPAQTENPAAGCCAGCARSPSTPPQRGRAVASAAEVPPAAGGACAGSSGRGRPGGRPGPMAAGSAVAYASVLRVAHRPPPPAAAAAKDSADTTAAAAAAGPAARECSPQWVVAAATAAAAASVPDSDVARGLPAGPLEPPAAGLGAGFADPSRLRLGGFRGGEAEGDGDGLWGLLLQDLAGPAGGSAAVTACGGGRWGAAAGLEAEAEWALL